MTRPDPDPDYPRREPLFALHFCRRVVDAGVANDLGPAAALLLVAVALREDAARYAGPVTFYNPQLLPLVGLGSVDALDRVRSAAVTAGWLRYRPGRKGVPGRYWVTVPDTDRPPSAGGDGRAASVPADGCYRPGADTTRRQAEGKPEESADATGFLGLSSAPVRTQPADKPGASAELFFRSSPCPDAEDGGDGPTGREADPVLRFPAAADGDWPLTAAQLADWAAAYPARDVLAECRKARAWLAAHPARRPTAAGLPAFLVRWLNRAGDRPPRPDPPTPPAPPPAATVDALERAGLL